MGYAFENYYKDQFGNVEVCIFIGRDADFINDTLVPGKFKSVQLYMDIEICGETIKEETIYGPLQCGASLRDQIGFGPAKDMLERMGIPKDCQIWRLGN